jgi:hypothetical protein
MTIIGCLAALNAFTFIFGFAITAAHDNAGVLLKFLFLVGAFANIILLLYGFGFMVKI